MKNTIKVGHDSEVFAKRPGVGYFPMIGQVGGTKHHPLPVPGGTLQEDNVSIEMAIDATADEDEFVERTNQVMAEMEKKIQEAGATMVIKPSVNFTENILEYFAPTSKESGCDPDYNIYTLRENDYPPIEETTYRHGSGHLHVDCAKAVQDPTYMRKLITLSDVYVKLPQFLLEGPVERNAVQGALGNYRPKEYGAEYRSSSNIILTDERILRRAFQGIIKASNKASRGNSISKSHSEGMRAAIQKNDRTTIKAYMDYFGVTEIKV